MFWEVLRARWRFPVLEVTLPALSSPGWQPTRDTIHSYARVLGTVRRALTPKRRHWSHISLRMTSTGFTTTPILAGRMTLELVLDLTHHQLVLTTSRGVEWRQPVCGQSPARFGETLLGTLAYLGVQPEVDRSRFSDDQIGAYDPRAAERLWQVFSQIDAVFRQFQGQLRGETSPVQLWPHHFDLALLWFSSRIVPGADPADEDSADEQMNFGFVTGDASVAEPYFYVTAYPLPDQLPGVALPEGTVWHSEGWQGAILTYASLLESTDPAKTLLAFLQELHRAGSRLMLTEGGA